MAKRDRSLTEGPILRGVILYTLPIMLSNLIQLLFNAADLIVVGQFCGSLTVGAVGATGAITSLIINLFIGLSVGVSASVANAYGKGDFDRVSRAIHSSIPLAFVCGAMLTFIGVLFAEPLLTLMKTPENVLPLSVVYMRVYFCGMIFTLLYNFSASILYALGDTKTPFLSLSMSGVLNVGLNVLFVTAFDMSVMGVALATVISQALSAFFVILAICKRTDGARLIIRKCRFYWDEIQKILRIGIPAGINSSLFAISNVIIQSSINSLGDIVVVGSSASENIEAFIAVSLNSFNSAAINYTSQNYGAKNFNRIKGTFKACFACVIILGALLALIAIISAPPVLSAYITDSPEALSFGIFKLCMLAPAYILSGLMNVSMSSLQGLESSVTPMLIGVIGVCGIRIAWAYTVFRILKTATILFSVYPISWAVTFICQTVAFYIVYKKKKQALQ